MLVSLPQLWSAVRTVVPWQLLTLTAAVHGGGLVWTAHLNAEGFFSRPVAGRDGTIYVVDTNWMLYAVRPPQPSRPGGTP